MDIKKVLFDLSVASDIAGIEGAVNKAAQYFSSYVDSIEIGTDSVVGVLNGDSNYSILIDAHIDEIGFIVTSVEQKGFLKVSAMGGIDARLLCSQAVVVHGKEEIIGVFCSTPPHLKKDSDQAPKLEDLYIDTGFNDGLKDIVKVGDRVTFLQTPAQLLGGRITGKSFDNRAGVAVAIEVARQLKKAGNIPCNVVFLLSDQEELGCRGAQTKAFELAPDEALVVDVSFGDGADIPEEKAGKLSQGTMIGISPVLSKKVTDKLIEIARLNDLRFQREVMGGTTSTNADVISTSKSGIPCGLLSIPLRNMHTTVEVVDINDIQSTADIIVKYVLSFKG